MTTDLVPLNETGLVSAAEQWPEYDGDDRLVITDAEAWFKWSEHVTSLALRSTNPDRRTYLFNLAEDCRRQAAGLPPLTP